MNVKGRILVCILYNCRKFYSSWCCRWLLVMFRFIYSVCDFKFNPFKVILKIPFKSSGCMLYHIHYKKMVEIQSVCDNEKYLLISWFVSNVYIKLVAIICVWIICYIYCRIVVVIICMSDTCYILYRTVVAIVCLWLTCYSHYMKVFAVNGCQ